MTWRMRKLAAAALFTSGVLACGARSELGDDTSTTNPSADAGPDVTFACAPLTPTVIATNPIAGVAGAPHVAGGFVTWLQLADGPADSWNGGAVEHIGTLYRVPTTGGVPVSLASFGIRSDRGMHSTYVGFDDQSMYWAADPIGKGPGETTGAIMRASLDGSNLTTIVGGLTHPSGVFVVGGRIYFGVKDALLRANVDGSDVQTLVASGFAFNAAELATADALYYAGFPNVAISSMPTTGGQFAKLIDVAWDGNFNDAPLLGALSVSGSTGVVMMTTNLAPSQPPASGTVARWSTNGGMLVPIASGFAYASPGPGSFDESLWSTAIDGDTVYFDSKDSILRVPLVGGTVETVGPVSTTSGIAFDDARVYWTSYDSNTLSVYAVCK